MHFFANSSFDCLFLSVAQAVLTVEEGAVMRQSQSAHCSVVLDAVGICSLSFLYVPLDDLCLVNYLETVFRFGETPSKAQKVGAGRHGGSWWLEVANVGRSRSMDASHPTHVSRQRSRRRTLLPLASIRSLFQRIHRSVRSHLHLPLPLPTTSHIRDASRHIATATAALPSGSPESTLNHPDTSAQQPFAIGTFIMSSSRGMRHAARQLRRVDETPLEHALRRSRRVAGEAPESGPYRPPPRLSPRRRPHQEAAPRLLAQPEPTLPPPPPPPSSAFTFTRTTPPVPWPGFGPDSPLPHTSPDPIQPSDLRPHLRPHLRPAMASIVRPQAATGSAHSQMPLGSSDPAKVEELEPMAEKKKIVCEICCEETEARVLQPCRLCAASYCEDCIRNMFLQATRDSTSMPPRCHSIFSTMVALDFLTTAEADAYRLKFEEWVSTKKTYCPVPKCSRFIPDRAVLNPPSTDPINLWDLLKQDLPAVITKLQAEHCARYFMNSKSPRAHGIDNWKEPKKMVWLEDIASKLPWYSDMAEFAADFNRLHAGGRSMPPQPSACADVLRRHLWKEVGKIKGRVNSEFAPLPATACFSCPECHIGICPSCKQVAHSGQPCDTAAQDHELAMLETYGYKKCPRCGHGVKRMYGCRHMQCRCGAHWCWACLLPFEECDGGCDSPGSASEGDYYSDEDGIDPETLQANIALRRARMNVQVGTVAVPTPTTASTGNVPAVPTTAPGGAARPGTSSDRLINLDAGSRSEWEASGAFFGAEPDEGVHDPIWSCAHIFNPAKLLKEAFDRGVPLGSECFRCFRRTYATVQKSDAGPSPTSQDFGKDTHKHTAEEDVAWGCDGCELLLCGFCKNEMVREQGL